MLVRREGKATARKRGAESDDNSSNGERRGVVSCGMQSEEACGYFGLNKEAPEEQYAQNYQYGDDNDFDQAHDPSPQLIWKAR